MTELGEAYGDNYQQASQQSKINYLVSNIANNLAHRQFTFKLTDTIDLWYPTQSLKESIINQIISKVKSNNKYMSLVHLKKNTNSINMLPKLVIDTPVEYFMMIDGEYHRAYYIYITPMEINSY